MTQVLYRYVNHADVVLLEKYPVIRTTLHGNWISVYDKKKFVLSNSRKRFACPTEGEAKISFEFRKARQLGILRAQIEGIEGALLAIKEGRLADYHGSMFNFD